MVDLSDPQNPVQKQLFTSAELGDIEKKVVNSNGDIFLGVNMGGSSTLNYYIIESGKEKSLIKEGLKTNEVKCYFTSPQTTNTSTGEDFYFTFFDSTTNNIVMYSIGPSSNYELKEVIRSSEIRQDINPLMTDNVSCSHFATIRDKVYAITHFQGGITFVKQNMYYELFNNEGSDQSIIPKRRTLDYIHHIIELRSTNDFLVFYGTTNDPEEKLIEVVYFNDIGDSVSININNEINLTTEFIMDYTTGKDSIYVTTLSDSGASIFHAINLNKFKNGDSSDMSSKTSLTGIGGELSVYSIK